MSRHDIARSNQSASGADVLSIREFFPHLGSAYACLAGTTGVNHLQPATSTFNLVRKFREEGGPSDILYRLGEHAASQALDVQIFNCNYTEVLDKPEREFMLKLMSLVLDPLVNLLQQLHRLAATVRTFFTTSDFALSTTKFCFGLFVPPRIGQRLVVRHRDELFQANINANLFPVLWQRFCFALNREAYIPLATVSFDCDCLTLAADWAMQFDFNLSDALDTEPVPYFHNGWAATLLDAVHFYDTRFHLDLSQ